MTTLAQYMNRLPRVSTWVIVAISMAVVVASFYGFMEVRYSKALEQELELSSEVSRLLRLQDRAPAEAIAQTAALEASRQRQEELGAFYSHPETDVLIAALSTAAQESSVALGSVLVGEARTQIAGDLQYRVQPLAVVLQGDAEDIFSFFELLHHRLPTATVSDVRVASLDSAPSARAQIFVSLAPEPLSEAEVQRRARVSAPKQRINP